MTREVLRLHGAGQLDAARTWLDWLLENEMLGIPTDALSGSLLARVWSQEETSRTGGAIEVAAAVMLASAGFTKEDVAPAIPILQRALADGAAGPGPRRVRDRADHGVPEREAGDAADPIAADLYKRWPRSQRALGLRVWTLVDQGKQAEGLHLAETEAKAHPDDVDASRFLAGVQRSRARWRMPRPRGCASRRRRVRSRRITTRSRGCGCAAATSASPRWRRPDVGSKCRTDASPSSCTRWRPCSPSATSPNRRARCWSNRWTSALRTGWESTTATCWDGSPRATPFWTPRERLYRDIKPTKEMFDISSYKLAQQRLARIGTGPTAGGAPAATTTKSAR